MEKRRMDANDARAVLERSAPEIESRARKGEAGAQFEFAIHHTDPVAKRIWFERAAAQGYPEAAKVVERMKRQSPSGSPYFRQ
jgi:hypothetical protein